MLLGAFSALIAEDELEDELLAELVSFPGLLAFDLDRGFFTGASFSFDGEELEDVLAALSKGKEGQK